MNIFSKLLKKERRPLWAGLLFLIISITSILLASHILYKLTVTLLTDNLHERILSISATSAINIDAHDLEALKTKDDWKKPEWSKVVNSLHNVKYANKDVVFMYIFRKSIDNPTEMEFVADADSINPYAQVDVNGDGKIESNGPDKLQWPGQSYPEAKNIPEILTAYTGSFITSNLYTDEYGTVITGYAPIKDINGKIVAILATDIKADDFFSITKKALRPFIGFITFLILLVSILVLLVVYVWKAYADSLEDLSKERSEFISITTHHIAAPLTVLQGYISMIDNGKIESNIINIIKKSTKEIIQVVRDFTDAYRIDEEKELYTFSPVKLNTFLIKIIEEHELLFKEKGLMFSYISLNKEVLLLLDEKKISQSLCSLLKNSLKYTLRGSVSIVVTDNRKEVVIKVKDKGIRNIPTAPNNLMKKFSKSGNQFEVNMLSKDLSLYVAKRVVEAHSGDFCISQKESMTEFTISLPLVDCFKL